MSKKQMAKRTLTHLDGSGRARMVSVADKPVTRRSATARGRIRMSPEAFRLIRDNGLAKGNALETARLAAIAACKQTATLIPLCHPVSISEVAVAWAARPPDRYEASVRVEGWDRTGMEMEAMTGAATACLALYDMAKAVDRAMTIECVELLAKSGGRSGEYRRKA